MQNRLLRICVATLAVAMLCAHVPRASADTISLEYLGNGNADGNGAYTAGGLSVNGISLTGTAGTFTSPVGQFHWGDPPNFPNQQIVNTFCVELTNHGTDSTPAVGGTATFRVGDLSELPGLTSSPISPDQVGAIKALYGNNYDFANDRATGTGALAQNFENAAFQLALWELLYDSGNTNLSGGNFSLANGPNDVYAPIKAEAASMLNNLNGGLAKYDSSGYQVVALLSPSGVKGSGETDFQNQITVQPVSAPQAVPAPPALMLAGIGVIGLVGRARWNRRKTA
jgi:hypothetical protein